MGKSLRESLAQFIEMDRGLSVPNAGDEKDTEASQNNETIDDFLSRQKEIRQERKRAEGSTRKEDAMDAIIRETSSMFQDDNHMVMEFDDYLENFMLDDEDDELRRNLIKRGRKYTRSTAISGESSEIEKAYAGREEALEKLLNDMMSDKEAIEKDINQMRMARSRNYKGLTEMQEQKTSLYNASLSAIKEMNNMTKTKIDLQMKADKSKKEEEEDDLGTSKAIQSLFGLGRDSFVESYADASGSSEAGSETYGMEDVADDAIERKYFSDDEPETDGDKFLKYEGRGVHYILEYDDDGPKNILAEDSDGNIIPDYPIPDLNDLEFTISANTGTATDNLSQQYQLRKL